MLPDLETYSTVFQVHLANELEALPQDCPRDFLVPNCSALGTFTLDHIHLRDKIKAAGVTND